MIATNYLRTSNTWASLPPVANFAPQAGITNTVANKIATIDARMHSVIEKGGYVYGAHSIYIPASNPTRSIIQFYQIGRGETNYFQIDDGTSHFAFPNIAVNDFGDVIVGYAKFSTDTFPSAAYRVKHYYDARFTAEEVFAAGVDYHVYHDASARNRWGDYTTSVVDPVNNRDFWTLGQFATNHSPSSPIQLRGRYGLKWANVLMPASSNDNFTNAITLSSGPTGTNSITMERLTREPGEPQHVSSDLVSAWYNWTPTNSGQVTFSLPASSGVAIVVYTGSTVSALTLIAQSAGASLFAFRPQHRATFTASSGTPYRIALVTTPDIRPRAFFQWHQPVAPIIVQQPDPPYHEVVDSFPFTLTAFASGNPLPALQWQRNGVSISGATGTNYTVATMTTNHAGTYRLIATNSSGSVTSEISTVVYFPSGAWPLGAGYWTNNLFNFPQEHVVGYQYIVFGTTNLVDWIALKTNTVPFTFTDDFATNYPYRFYRTEFKP
jgi:hypothetical protein